MHPTPYVQFFRVRDQEDHSKITPGPILLVPAREVDGHLDIGERVPPVISEVLSSRGSQEGMQHLPHVLHILWTSVLLASNVFQSNDIVMAVFDCTDEVIDGEVRLVFILSPDKNIVVRAAAAAAGGGKQRSENSLRER